MEQNNIEEIKKKAEKFESQYAKLKQEFKDYIEASRKNEEKKRQEMKTDSAKRLLVVADSLNRISASSDTVYSDMIKNYSENLKKNIDVIYSQLISSSGLALIDPVPGDKFDEQMHIAIGLEYGTVYPENSVFRVIRKGYRIENSVVRPAEVIVSKRPVEAKVIKPEVTKPGFWERFQRRIYPAKFRFSEINQKIDELGRIHKEKTDKLTQDLSSLKNALTEMEAKNQNTSQNINQNINQNISELGRIYKEKTDKLAQEMASLKNALTEMQVKNQNISQNINQNISELGRIHKEKIDKLTQDLDSLKNALIEQETKNRNINELGRIHKEKIEKLMQDVSSLKNSLMVLETKNLSIRELEEKVKS